jgi:hypothetical protein
MIRSRFRTAVDTFELTAVDKFESTVSNCGRTAVDTFKSTRRTKTWRTKARRAAAATAT